jgi:hypothetical protein
MKQLFRIEFLQHGRNKEMIPGVAGIPAFMKILCIAPRTDFCMLRAGLDSEQTAAR